MEKVNPRFIKCTKSLRDLAEGQRCHVQSNEYTYSAKATTMPPPAPTEPPPGPKSVTVSSKIKRKASELLGGVEDTKKAKQAE